MPVQSIAWNGYHATKGARFRLDYVLREPPEAELPAGSLFPGELIGAVVGNWPGLAVEKVERKSVQVVHVHVIKTRAGDLAQSLNEWVVVPAVQIGNLGRPGEIDVGLWLSGVWQPDTSIATEDDIQQAEESDADAFRDPPIVELAENVRDALADVATSSPVLIRAAPFVAIAAVLLLAWRR